jgi:hypothetical protein
LEIILEVAPSFSLPLEITVGNGVIAYQGNPDPEIYGPGSNVNGKISISPSDLNDLLEGIKTYQTTVFPKVSPIGYDGTFYTISFKNGFNSITYSWWEDCYYVKKDAIK